VDHDTSRISDKAEWSTRLDSVEDRNRQDGGLWTMTLAEYQIRQKIAPDHGQCEHLLFKMADGCLVNFHSIGGSVLRQNVASHNFT
jgi:hypothetical protein